MPLSVAPSCTVFCVYFRSCVTPGTPYARSNPTRPDQSRKPLADRWSRDKGIPAAEKVHFLLERQDDDLVPLADAFDVDEEKEFLHGWGQELPSALAIVFFRNSSPAGFCPVLSNQDAAIRQHASRSEAAASKRALRWAIASSGPIIVPGSQQFWHPQSGEPSARHCFDGVAASDMGEGEVMGRPYACAHAFVNAFALTLNGEGVASVPCNADAKQDRSRVPITNWKR